MRQRVGGGDGSGSVEVLGVLASRRWAEGGSVWVIRCSEAPVRTPEVSGRGPKERNARQELHKLGESRARVRSEGGTGQGAAASAYLGSWWQSSAAAERNEEVTRCKRRE